MLPRHPGTPPSRVTTSPDSHRDALALLLEKSPEFEAYCRLLSVFVKEGRGENALAASSGELAEFARLYHCPPAMLMQSLYRAACFVTSSPEGQGEVRGRRYATALDRLLNACCPPADLSS